MAPYKIDLELTDNPAQSACLFRSRSHRNCARWLLLYDLSREKNGGSTIDAYHKVSRSLREQIREVRDLDEIVPLVHFPIRDSFAAERSDG